MNHLFYYVLTRFLFQTRWGVGFGPRDCSDYQTGVSVIPIERLTDADRKWLATAEYGGTGGKPLEGGLVVEEPDIEIGAGVSSKGKQYMSTQILPPHETLIDLTCSNLAPYGYRFWREARPHINTPAEPEP